MKCEKCNATGYLVTFGNLEYTLCLSCEDNIQQLIEGWIREEW